MVIKNRGNYHKKNVTRVFMLKNQAVKPSKTVVVVIVCHFHFTTVILLAISSSYRFFLVWYFNLLYIVK